MTRILRRFKVANSLSGTAWVTTVWASEHPLGYAYAEDIVETEEIDLEHLADRLAELADAIDWTPVA
jgi:hypothetical protein